MDADEREHILAEIFADSGSEMSLDESSPPTSEDSDEEHIPTSSSSSEKQNFRSGWRTASAPDYKRIATAHAIYRTHQLYSRLQ